MSVCMQFHREGPDGLCCVADCQCPCTACRQRVAMLHLAELVNGRVEARKLTLEDVEAFSAALGQCREAASVDEWTKPEAQLLAAASLMATAVFLVGYPLQERLKAALKAVELAAVILGRVEVLAGQTGGQRLLDVVSSLDFKEWERAREAARAPFTGPTGPPPAAAPGGPAQGQ